MQEMESEADEGLLESEDNEKGPGRGRARGRARGRGRARNGRGRARGRGRPRGRGRARGQGRSEECTGRRGCGQGSHGRRGRGGRLSEEAGAAENQANHDQQLVVRKLVC